MNNNNVEPNTGTPPNVEMQKANRMAVMGLVFGLISIIGWLLPLIGFPVTILAIVFGARGLKSEKRGKAIAGLILGIIFLVATLINSIAGAVLAVLGIM